MRKNPFPDADAVGPPENVQPVTPEASASAEAPPPGAEDAAAPSEDNTSPSLVWPPVDEELNDWEVLNLESGHTIIEPMKLTPPAGAAGPPPTPAPYVAPEPIDDPAGETSLLPISADLHLPETELIEPLTTPPGVPAVAADSGVRAAWARSTATPDDRTVVIPRPANLTPKPEPPTPVFLAPASPASSQEDTNPDVVGTRILVAPAFAASVGHAPTVPVSAVHRAPRPQPVFGPRRPMEETLPAGVIRETLVSDRAADESDETVVHAGPQGDTHPVPIARRAVAGPAGAPTPFSRVPSRARQPVATDAAPEPAPISLAPPPLAFGPRGAASGASIAAPSIAPVPIVFPVPAHAVHDVPIPSRPAPRSTRRKLLALAGALLVVALLALGVYQVLSMRNTAASAPTRATLSVESSPAGAVVAIDGTPRGNTPLRLELSEGQHALDVSLDGATRHVPLTLAGGTVTAHSFEFAPTPAPTAADAAIEIRSQPAGGRVLVDGVARGTTPIVVTGLTAGQHEVQVTGPFRTVTRTVTLTAGRQTLLSVTPARTPTSGASQDERPPRASADTGFLSIQSPIPLRVVRNGDFIGTSEDARLSLPAGPQVIGLENESVGFRDVRTVEVIAGKVTPVPVLLPKGEISINARPWAEVFVDGDRVGETPVSQLSLPVGVHEVVFRHPELGERRVAVIVKIGATGRAFTDFTK